MAIKASVEVYLGNLPGDDEAALTARIAVTRQDFNTVWLPALNALLKDTTGGKARLKCSPVTSDGDETFFNVFWLEE